MKNQSSEFNVVRLELTGVAPLIQHNGQTADPLNKFTKIMKPLTSKRNKTDADHLEISRVEFHAGLYVNENDRIIVPAKNLSAVLVAGAKKAKLGNQFKSGAFVSNDSILKFEDADKSPSELWDMGEKYVLRVPVGVNNSTVIRTRPIFRTWSLIVEIEFEPEIIDALQILKAMQDAGRLCGLCDWSPQNGRFLVKELKD